MRQGVSGHAHPLLARVIFVPPPSVRPADGSRVTSWSSRATSPDCDHPGTSWPSPAETEPLGGFDESEASVTTTLGERYLSTFKRKYRPDWAANGADTT
jgi:hypothetical protein